MSILTEMMCVLGKQMLVKTYSLSDFESVGKIFSSFSDERACAWWLAQKIDQVKAGPSGYAEEEERTQIKNRLQRMVSLREEQSDHSLNFFNSSVRANRVGESEKIVGRLLFQLEALGVDAGFAFPTQKKLLNDVAPILLEELEAAVWNAGRSAAQLQRKMPSANGNQAWQIYWHDWVDYRKGLAAVRAREGAELALRRAKKLIGAPQAALAEAARRKAALRDEANARASKEHAERTAAEQARAKLDEVERQVEEKKRAEMLRAILINDEILAKARANSRNR